MYIKSSEIIKSRWSKLGIFIPQEILTYWKFPQLEQKVKIVLEILKWPCQHISCWRKGRKVEGFVLTSILFHQKCQLNQYLPMKCFNSPTENCSIEKFSTRSSWKQGTIVINPWLSQTSCWPPCCLPQTSGTSWQQQGKDSVLGGSRSLVAG